MEDKHKASEKEIEQNLEKMNYPASEDIYSQNKEEADLNPEEISKNKTTDHSYSNKNEDSFEDVVTGVDLDVPGAELDDVQENIGSEDEENNYYSESDTK